MEEAMDDVPAVTPVEKEWHSVVRKKRVQITEEDKESKIVYLTGVEENLKKLNPLKLKDMIKVAAGGEVEKIYQSGNSLKIYCRDENQKERLLKSSNLDTINVTSSEKITGYKSEGSRSTQVKNDRCVISGVSLELTESEIIEETHCIKAIRMQKFEGGKRTPSLSIILMYNKGTTP